MTALNYSINKNVNVAILQISRSTFSHKCLENHTKPLGCSTILTNEEYSLNARPWETG